jgi:hypothetical protein
MLRRRDVRCRRLPASVVGLVVLIVGLSAASGCHVGDCVEGLDLGTTYRVTVLEPADANSQYAVQTSHGPDFGTSVDTAGTCGAGFDFTSGSTFLVKPVSKVDLMGCYGRTAIPSEVAEIQLVNEMSGGTGAGYLMATPAFQVDRGEGCTGQWQLQFISPRNDPPLTTPVLGDYPPVVMMRTFTVIPGTDVQSCLLPNSRLAAYSNCFDYFVVKLDKT